LAAARCRGPAPSRCSGARQVDAAVRDFRLEAGRAGGQHRVKPAISQARRSAAGSWSRPSVRLWAIVFEDLGLLRTAGSRRAARSGFEAGLGDRRRSRGDAVGLERPDSRRKRVLCRHRSRRPAPAAGRGGARARLAAERWLVAGAGIGEGEVGRRRSGASPAAAPPPPSPGAAGASAIVAARRNRPGSGSLVIVAGHGADHAPICWAYWRSYRAADQHDAAPGARRASHKASPARRAAPCS